jgi:hypothetical protein
VAAAVAAAEAEAAEQAAAAKADADAAKAAAEAPVATGPGMSPRLSRADQYVARVELRAVAIGVASLVGELTGRPSSRRHSSSGKFSRGCSHAAFIAAAPLPASARQHAEIVSKGRTGQLSRIRCTKG